MEYFTSDLHFWHKRILDYCIKRPWKSVPEMNEGLIRNWNSTVQYEDTVYILGDFSFGGTGKIKSVLDRLVGHKILILGNHAHGNKNDKWIRLGMDEVVHDTKTMTIFGYDVLLNHFPYKGYEVDNREFDCQLKDDGKFLLHGHVHESWKVNNRMINVGVDVNDYKPVALPDIVKTMQQIIWAEGGHYHD